MNLVMDRADQCRTCPAFRFASGQSKPLGGKAAAKTAREFRKLLAADEVPSDNPRSRFLLKLAQMDDDEFEKAWPRFIAFLNDDEEAKEKARDEEREKAEKAAKDKGEGFETPMQRELERMDDPRNLSPDLNTPGGGPPPFKGRPRPGGAMDGRMALDRRAFDRVRPDDGKARGQTFAAAGVKIDHAEILAGIERRMEGRR